MTGLKLLEEAKSVSFPDVPEFRKLEDFGRVTDDGGVRESVCVCVEMSVGERSSLGEGVDDGGSRK